VIDEGLSGKSDREVWEVACAEKRFFVTMDTDFTDIRHFPPGTHAGILGLVTKQINRLTSHLRAIFVSVRFREILKKALLFFRLRETVSIQI
jgi:predicted nuclease of predicted toxin-antitoxin system